MVKSNEVNKDNDSASRPRKAAFPTVPAAPAPLVGLVDFSAAERVKRFDCVGNAVFLLDFRASGGNFACKSGKINKPLARRAKPDGSLRGFAEECRL